MEQPVQKKNFLELATEIIGWLQIVFFPLLIGALAGFLIYISNPSTSRLIIAIIVASGGLITGIIWANRIWKKKGTINFISRVNASPELDNLEHDNNHK